MGVMDTSMGEAEDKVVSTPKTATPRGAPERVSPLARYLIEAQSEQSRRQNEEIRRGFDGLREDFHSLSESIRDDAKETRKVFYRLMALLIIGIMGMGGLNFAFKAFTVSQGS